MKQLSHPELARRRWALLREALDKSRQLAEKLEPLIWDSWTEEDLRAVAIMIAEEPKT